MKVIFLSIGGFESIEAHDQYPDLLREFISDGHEVYVVCSNEKRTGLPTKLINDHDAKILRVQIGNITQSSQIEKGLATIRVGSQYKKAINKYFGNIKFDLILYTTPPITLASVVRYLKKRDNAFTYLILKDIFPQNAVDLGMLRVNGIKGILYRYFRLQEKKLYNSSDKIGTMSRANSNYLLTHNSYIAKEKVEICPNCLEPRPILIDDGAKRSMREKYDIPCDKKVFVYGGNLGRPQDIPFVIKCIKECENIPDVYFWIIGNGTEYKLLEQYAEKEKSPNFKLSSRLPKEDYDTLIASCDVGLVFLDYRFTIPNFPSRMLSYMQAGLPVLSCTDRNTDIDEAITSGGFGWSCESDSPVKFANIVKEISLSDLSNQIEQTRKHLYDYSARKSFEIINNSFRHC